MVPSDHVDNAGHLLAGDPGPSRTCRLPSVGGKPTSHRLGLAGVRATTLPPHCYQIKPVSQVGQQVSITTDKGNSEAANRSEQNKGPERRRDREGTGDGGQRDTRQAQRKAQRSLQRPGAKRESRRKQAWRREHRGFSGTG